MCCDFHIGVNHSEKRLDCRKSCSKVINAKKKTDMKKLIKQLNKKFSKLNSVKKKTKKNNGKKKIGNNENVKKMMQKF